MSSKRIGAFLFLMLTAVRISAAQQIINSLFTPPGSDISYSNPANWSPPEVPNNSPAKNYNVSIFSPVDVDIDVTISNLLTTSAGLRDQNMTVTGTTTIYGPGQFSGGIGVISDHSSASFVTNSLSSFSGGVLDGGFSLYVRDGTSGSATLQFHGADVRTLTGILLLEGPMTRFVDESGNDALRNLTHIEGQLLLTGHQLSVAGPFTNDGSLTISSSSSQPGLFTIKGELTNFDPATRTLKNGAYTLGECCIVTNQPATLQFSGADIVHNSASILLNDPLGKIVDENGADALRNFSHNTSTGFFGIQNFHFSKPGDFTNDGYLYLFNGALTIQGELTNFDPVTQTLTGGAYHLYHNEGQPSSTLAFAGADIANNAASISLIGSARILDQNGNDALRNLAHNLPGAEFNLFDYLDFIAPSDFTNAGEVAIVSYSKPQSRFVLPTNHRYLQTEGATHLGGGAIIGDVEINGGSFDAGGFSDEGPAILDGNLVVGAALFIPRILAVQGTVQLSDSSRFSTSGESDNGFTVSGSFTAAGTLEIAGAQTQPPGAATFLVVGGSIVGTFSNAPNGARIPTIDGLGSFVVSYGFDGIHISGYQALPEIPHLLNISTRAPVGTGENVLIGGFIVTGTEPKRVILRALGPSLSSLFPGTLSDPALELHDPSGSLIASNDNWRTDQEAEIIATGVPPVSNYESALVATLPANNSAYTAIVRGADGGTGIGVVEVYDLDRTTDSKLANISTRGVVQTGDNILIGGLIVLGQNPMHVIVRALGPSLPVSGQLPDPTLSLYDSNGVLVAFNDNWRSDQQAEIIATGLAPGNDLDAAIVTTFRNIGGSYTAVVQGRDGSTGVALVEVYDLGQ